MTKEVVKSGAPCPGCDGAEEAKYVALVSMNIEGEDVLPHRYKVGPACYSKQWAAVYPNEPDPLAANDASEDTEEA